jgi:hypothetical protein
MPNVAFTQEYSKVSNPQEAVTLSYIYRIE